MYPTTFLKEMLIAEYKHKCIRVLVKNHIYIISTGNIPFSKLKYNFECGVICEIFCSHRAWNFEFK